MSNEEALEWDGLITRVATRVCRDFPGVETEEVISALWVRICSLPRSLDIHRPGVVGIITYLARGEAWKQRSEYLRATCQYTYRPSDVRRMLEDTFDVEDWSGGYVPEDAKSLEYDPMDPIDLRADITKCFAKLPESYQEALRGRYRDKEVPSPHTAERKRLDRAVWYLTDLLNSFYWQPGKGLITNVDVLEMLGDVTR